MKVAVLHYWFVTRRGGEKVVEEILKIFPEADVYTLFYDKNKYGNHLQNQKVYSSILNNPFFRKRHQKVFPLYPLGVKSLKLKEEYDLIISSESGPIKGVSIPRQTPHICYIHSPMRYCWGFTHEYTASVNPIMKPILKILFEFLRIWDKTTIDNVDLYIANSKNVASRVKKYYHRDSKVVYPPIALSCFDAGDLNTETKAKDTYLSFGAITPYKRIDLLVEAFNENGKKLVVIGDGSERIKNEQKAKENITFTGNLDWETIETIFAKTKALIFPGEEDFGMIPLEVMAYGIPVLAFGKGGALETVVENNNNRGESSGLFFKEQSSNEINKCIERFESEEHSFSPAWIKNHSKSFGEDVFRKNMEKEIKEFMDSYARK